jgi:hypothetical protein
MSPMELKSLRVIEPVQPFERGELNIIDALPGSSLPDHLDRQLPA